MSLVYGSSTLFFLMIYFSKFNKKVILFFPLIFFIIFTFFYSLNILNFKFRVKDSYDQVFRPNHMDGIAFFSAQHEVYSKTSIELFKKEPILGIGDPTEGYVFITPATLVTMFIYMGYIAQSGNGFYFKEIITKYNAGYKDKMPTSILYVFILIAAFVASSFISGYFFSY